MNDQGKKKVLAVEIVLLLVVSGSVGYLIVSRQGSSPTVFENERTEDVFQETILTTGEVGSSVKAHIKAGPLTGYGPLAVTFYGNPDEDANITSYHWQFSPTSLPIVPQAQYKTMRFSVLFFFLSSLVFFPLGFAYLLFYAVASHMRYKAASQYESTERDPTMVFLYTGSYSATLTVTDTEGNTSSDIVWVTVLQYVTPDHFD
jgi:hypothetical protein